MAFQVVDDILDIVSTDEELGKPSGNDLVEGIYTLPVLFTLGFARWRRAAAPILGDKLEPEAREAARALVKRSGAIESALEVAQSYADHAADLRGRSRARSRAVRSALAADDLMARVAAAAAR